ncbi:hypothetical protein Atai01_54500 [Amycolatopsis taiwanensis]|uniref:Uncharacterized protein n=1 Tax=Amycolatopsis taiwanensis TaxID=342230 RepID=A0A9W6R3H5_9PSEU|nr:hypothetical protein Atai01_54500 [Amycolatopsis taiwanensis]
MPCTTPPTAGWPPTGLVHAEVRASDATTNTEKPGLTRVEASLSLTDTRLSVGLRTRTDVDIAQIRATSGGALKALSEFDGLPAGEARRGNVDR